MAEREKFGQADETLVDKAGGGWSARVDWQQVADSWQPAVDKLTAKIEEKRAAKDALAQEEGYADRKSMRKGQRVAKLEGKMEDLDPESGKYKRLENRAKRKASKINYTEDLTLKDHTCEISNNEEKKESSIKAKAENFFPLLKSKGKVSPLKFGRANATLINSTRRAAQAQFGGSDSGFSQAAKAFDTVWNSYNEKIKESATQELEDYDIAKADIGFKGFGNGANESKRVLGDLKNNMAKLKSDALKANYRGPKFNEIKEKLQTLEDKADVLNSNMITLQGQKDDWAEANGYSGNNNTGNSIYSQGSNDVNISYLNQINSKNARMVIDDEDMSIKFEVTGVDGSTKLMSYEEASKGVYLMDTKGQKDYLKYSKQIIDDLRINKSEFREDKAKSKINAMLKGASDAKIISWMKDDLTGDGTSFYESYEAKFPETVAEFPDAFKPGSETWKTPLEGGATFGDMMIEEMKEYYLEKLRGEYNFYSNSLDKGEESSSTTSIDNVFDQYLESNNDK